MTYSTGILINHKIKPTSPPIATKPRSPIDSRVKKNNKKKTGKGNDYVEFSIQL